MGILIDTVRIKNFRSLKNVEVKLSPLTLLVGSNNSGKTSFLKAMQLALGIERIYISKEDFFIGRDDTDNEDKEILIDILILPVDEQFQRVSTFEEKWINAQFGNLVNLDENDNDYIAFRTKISFDEIENTFVVQRYNLQAWQKDFENWDKSSLGDKISKFKHIPLYFIHAQRDIQQEIKTRSSYLGKLSSQAGKEIDKDEIEKIENQINALNEKVIESSEILTHLKTHLEALNKTIQASGRGVELTPFNKKVRDISKGLNIHFQDAGAESFPLEYHGMGTRSWASLLTFNAFLSWQAQVRQTNDTAYHPILALEEPEAHLHPNAQRHIYNQLKDVGGQKIISTHSPYIAGQSDLNEIRHFSKQSDCTEINSLALTDLTPEDIRKINREVMNTRGELLFSRAIILFEGETEEQAFPIFAQKYWGVYPFEIGLNFIGVGSDNNYLPFLTLPKNFNIPWFIFSDGENKAIDAVKKVLNLVGITDVEFPENVKIIPNNNNFESYLIQEGYQNEIKRAVIEFQTPNFKNEYHANDKKQKISGWTDEDLLKYMKDWKTKLSPIYAKNISEMEDKTKRFPIIIKELFEIISTQFGLKISEENL